MSHRLRSKSVGSEKGGKDLAEKLEEKDQEITRLKSEMNDLKTIAERYNNQYNRCQDELRDLKSRQDDKNSEIAALKAQNDALVARIGDLEKQIHTLQESHREALVSRDKELQNMREAMAEQIKMHQELMNIKLSLDAEILTYRKLLEGEETRLHIDVTPPPQRKTPRKQKPTPQQDKPETRAAKRRRLEDGLSAVRVAIEDSDPGGDYIKLHNTSDTDQPLGGWVLKRSADGVKEVAYKFAGDYVLEGGKEVFVWSSNAGQGSNPPTDLISKNTSWGVGKRIETTLVDASGEVRATRVLVRKASSDQETGLEFTEFDDEEDPEKRCAIM